MQILPIANCTNCERGQICQLYLRKANCNTLRKNLVCKAPSFWFLQQESSMLPLSSTFGFQTFLLLFLVLIDLVGAYLHSSHLQCEFLVSNSTISTIFGLKIFHQGGIIGLLGGSFQLEASEVQHCTNRRLLQVNHPSQCGRRHNDNNKNNKNHPS